MKKAFIGYKLPDDDPEHGRPGVPVYVDEATGCACYPGMNLDAAAAVWVLVSFHPWTALMYPLPNYPPGPRFPAVRRR